MDLNKINNYCKDPYKKALVRKKKYHYGDVDQENLMKTRYKGMKQKPKPTLKENDIFIGLKQPIKKK